MSIYISRAELLKEIENTVWNTEGDKAEAYYIATQIEPADVQEVILCANCKFWDRQHISCEGLARCNTGESGIRYRSRNDFCSRAAKIDEEVKM